MIVVEMPSWLYGDEINVQINPWYADKGYPVTSYDADFKHTTAVMYYDIEKNKLERLNSIRIPNMASMDSIGGNRTTP